MKKKKVDFSPKLFLNKSSIIALNSEHKEGVVGGATEIYDPAITGGGCGPCNGPTMRTCPTNTPSQCPSVPNAQGLCCSIIP